MLLTKVPAAGKSSVVAAFIVAALLSAASVLVSSGTAYAGKWCASYNDGSTNCGFDTLQECEADVKGVGGTCQPNS